MDPTLKSSYILRNPGLSPNEPLYLTPYPGYTNLSSIMDRAFEQYAERPCMGRRFLKKVHRKEQVVDENGTKKVLEFPELTEVRYKTYAEVADLISNVGTNLLDYGSFKKGDKVGIYLDTSMEWQITAQACFRYGVILSTCYANLGEEALVHVVNECELEVMIVGSLNVSNLERLKSQMPTLKKLIIVRDITDERETLSSNDFQTMTFEELSRKPTVPIPERPEIDSEDTCVIMYTSGSTGVPKGVVVPHRALLASAGAVGEQAKIVKEDTLMAYLPLAHILELAAEIAFLMRGSAIGYGSPRTLTAKGVGPLNDDKRKGDIEAIAPTAMPGVPRVWTTIMKGALEQVEQGSFLKRWLFNTALNQKRSAVKNGSDTPFWNWLVFNKLRQKVGGRLRLMVSGGAPLAVDVHEFLHTAFCCDVIQGYGLTETCGGGTIQPAGTPLSTGNIGPPIKSNEIKLVDVPDMGYDSQANPPTGEVWIRGPNVNIGYYKQDDKTKEAWTEDGWFCTGDVGRFNPDGTVSIIDRKKNLIKMAHGEYVAVENLEMIYCGSPFVAPGGIWVYADSFHDDCVAVIVPQESFIKSWAKVNGLGNLNWFQLLKAPEVKRAILDSVNDIAKQHKKKRFEYISDCVLIGEPFGPENGSTTASMKLARHTLAQLYASDIEKMYAGLGK